MTTAAISTAAMIRPIRDGSHVQTVPQGSFGRIKKKRGARQLIFMPGLFFKIGRNVVERSNIERECNSLQRAAKHRFWRPLLSRVFRIPIHGFVGRRLRPATPDDFDRLVETVESLLEASLSYPATDAYEGVERRPLFQHLSTAEQKALGKLLSQLQLPETSMHCDVHVFNFVFAGETPRLVDWEFFDPKGSFVYDYLDFFISVSSINSDDSWHTIMRRLGPNHPAIASVARRLGVSPRVLLTYYLFVKVNMILSLHGTFTRVSDEFFEDATAGLRGALRAS
jgi:hypothetical protein